MFRRKSGVSGGMDAMEIMASWPAAAEAVIPLLDPRRGRLPIAIGYAVRPLLALAVIALTVGATPALAKDHVVKMLNRGKAGAMVFEPAVVRIAPGDRVTFQPTDRGHDVQSVPGMIPAGAQPFKGKISQPLTVTFAKPGVYGYRCVPHYAMGMVGAVVVGTPAPNIAAARAVRHPGRAGQVFATLLR